MKITVYTVLKSYGYDSVLVIKYFCTTTNFWPTYIRAYGDLSNPCLGTGKKVFQGGPSPKRGQQGRGK